MRGRSECDSRLTRSACPFSLSSSQVLLLVRALLVELADDLFSESSGFRKDVVESIEYLF